MKKRTLNIPVKLPLTFIPRKEYTGLAAVFVLIYLAAIYAAVYFLLDFLTLFFFGKVLPGWFKICTIFLLGRFSHLVIAAAFLVEGYILLSGHTTFPHL